MKSIRRESSCNLDMELDAMLMKILVSLAFVALLGLFIPLYRAIVTSPSKKRSALWKQGIGGPSPTFLLGNILEMKKAQTVVNKKALTPSHHNVAAFLFPFLEEWEKQFGGLFMFSIGHTVILYANKDDIWREMMTCTSLDIGKPTYLEHEYGPLFGKGILSSNGSVWAYHRDVLAPELYRDKVKGMTNLIIECSAMLVKNWSKVIEREGGAVDMKVDADLRKFSGDVISRACFGSSYSKGEEIFSKLRRLQEISSQKSMSEGIPGMRYLPTKYNRITWALGKEIDTLILKLVKERKEAGREEDLLHMILEAASKNGNMSQDEIDQFIVGNCKNIYQAGYETTAVTLMWCLMLLAAHPEWQERVRDEIFTLCGDQNLNVDALPKMKQLTMAILESLRLYSPVPIAAREALSDIKFGNLHIPKGVNIWGPVLKFHTDPQLWGPDSYEFHPERFANGITGACTIPHLYMPFGLGLRICLGQNLAMTELKIVLAMLLFNFSFAPSPNYVHSPSVGMIMEPKYGVDLLVKKL